MKYKRAKVIISTFDNCLELTRRGLQWGASFAGYATSRRKAQQAGQPLNW